jgi:hypothetical protein
LAGFKKRIGGFLKKRLRLKLHEKKTFIAPADRGIDFLGYFVKPDHILVRRKVVQRCKKRLRQIAPAKSQAVAKKNLAVVNSYYAHFAHADSYRLRKCIYENLGGLKENYEPWPNFESLFLRQ